MAFITTHPVLTAAAAAAAVTGGLGALSQFREDRTEPAADRLNRSAMTGVRAAGAAAVLTGVGYGLYANRSRLGAGPVGTFFKKQYASALAQAGSDRRLLAPSMGNARAAVEAYGRNARIMSAGGVGAGFLIGAAYGHPVLGAGIGLGVGMAAKTGIGAVSTWKKAARYPGLRTAGVASMAALVFMGTQALAPQYQSETSISQTADAGEAFPEKTTVKDRLGMLKARGELVLGLSNRRHG